MSPVELLPSGSADQRPQAASFGVSVPAAPEQVEMPRSELDPVGESAAVLGARQEAHLRAAYRDLLPRRRDLQRHLQGVITDVLNRPGSLVRAKLVYALLSQWGVGAEDCAELAVGTEYFHAASLVFDDLPAMDDAQERRGFPCPHRVHGEAAAMLGALALINRAYALLWHQFSQLPAERRQRAAQLVESCMGVDGILDGQSRDLHFAAGSRRPEDVLKIAEGKTVSLIRLTLLLPAIVVAASPAEEKALERLSEVWGLSYQILDDFKDCLMTPAESGKSNQRDALLGRPSFPAVAGFDKAWKRVHNLMAEGRQVFDELLRISDKWRPLGHVEAILLSDFQHLHRSWSEAA